MTPNKAFSFSKYKYLTGVLAACLVSIAVFQNCSKTELGNGSSNSNAGALAFSGSEMINVTAATASDCPNGGNVYAVYMDSNGNGHQDSSEPSITTQAVCNGANGATGAAGTNGTNGSAALLSMSRVTVSAGTCASGTGVQLSSGTDANNNNILDASEISGTEILCDGANGAVGAAGAAGSNGHSMVTFVTTAPAGMCPAGGSLIAMALDVQDTGVYSATDPEQQSVLVCNGVNGTNGTNGTNGLNAPPTPYTPMQVIYPCGNTTTYKEILLILESGQVLASFSDNANGNNTRLTLLPDGTYQDTDGTNCTFSLGTSSNGNTRTISWSGKVQQSWAITH